MYVWVQRYVYIRIYIYIYIYVCVDMYVYTYTSMHIYIYMQKYFAWLTCMHAYEHTYIFTHIHRYIHTYESTCSMRMHIHSTHIQCRCILGSHTQTHRHACIHILTCKYGPVWKYTTYDTPLHRRCHYGVLSFGKVPCKTKTVSENRPVKKATSHTYSFALR